MGKSLTTHLNKTRILIKPSLRKSIEPMRKTNSINNSQVIIDLNHGFLGFVVVFL